MDDFLLDFSSDIGEVDDDGLNNKRGSRTPLPSLTRNNGPDSASFTIFNSPLDHPSPPFPDFEEELEWLAIKHGFPGVDTFFDDGLCNPIPKQLSPVSVLENSNNSSTGSAITTNTNTNTMMSCCGNLSVPVRARSKCRRTRRRDFQKENLWWGVEKPVVRRVSMGRKCQHCGAEKTPQWRAGPLGPKTLCNACGVRYKSGRLVPEYRPASSPTFSSELHSNSHRKVVEMRRQKMMLGLG